MRGRSLFYFVVDVYFDLVIYEEFVVWGVGEDIVGWYRECQGLDKLFKFLWYSVNGKELGFRVVYDDVNLVKIVNYYIG